MLTVYRIASSTRLAIPTLAGSSAHEFASTFTSWQHVWDTKVKNTHLSNSQNEQVQTIKLTALSLSFLERSVINVDIYINFYSYRIKTVVNWCGS